MRIQNTQARSYRFLEAIQKENERGEYPAGIEIICLDGEFDSRTGGRSRVWRFYTTLSLLEKYGLVKDVSTYGGVKRYAITRDMSFRQWQICLQNSHIH